MKTIYIIAFFLVNLMATVLVSAKDIRTEDSGGDIDVLDEVTLDRKQATEFKKYRRWFWPNIDEECYHECCSREEVNEHFSSKNADDYWKKYQKWTKTSSSHC